MPDGALNPVGYPGLPGTRYAFCITCVRYYIADKIPCGTCANGTAYIQSSGGMAVEALIRQLMMTVAINVPQLAELFNETRHLVIGLHAGRFDKDDKKGNDKLNKLARAVRNLSSTMGDNFANLVVALQDEVAALDGRIDKVEVKKVIGQFRDQLARVPVDMSRKKRTIEFEEDNKKEEVVGGEDKPDRQGWSGPDGDLDT